MPRQKRTLAEADANALQPAPKLSRMTTTLAGKENQMSALGSKTNAELASMLKVRGLPYSGKKAELIARLAEAASSSRDSTEHSAQASTGTSSEDIEYLTMCRPFDDIEAEKRANDEDYDSEEDEDLNTCGTDSCMCKKPYKEHPEWKWIISEKGYNTVKHMRTEAMHRDQDFMDQYQYNDFTGYGFQEMVNNQLQAFHNEYTKKSPDPLTLWGFITGFAHVLPGPGDWYMCDDSQQIVETMKLIGYAILATGDVLKSHGLVNANSKIKDLPLVLAMCIEMARHWEGFVQGDELDWRVPLIKQAEANGVKLSGPFGIENRVAELKESYAGKEALWTKFDWKQKVSLMC